MIFDKLKILGYRSKIRLNRFFRYFSNPNFDYKQSRYFLKEYSIDKKNVFFGYYDLNPFNKKNLILACVNSTNSQKMEVGYFDLNSTNNKFIKISETKTWCWQMGCRLQWYKGTDHLIFFNDFSNGRYISRIFNIETNNDEKVLDSPLFCLSKGGEFGLSLNFSRLEKLRPGYGYSLIADSNIDIKEPQDDGLFLIDIKYFSRYYISFNYLNYGNALGERVAPI